MDTGFTKEIFSIRDAETFRAAALEVFRFQAAAVPVYRDYLEALRVDPGRIQSPDEIPFLPVEFFKTHRILPEGMNAELVFESSGTTLATPARHHVADVSIYRESLLRSFYACYGSPEDLCILALLPSYLERSSSSLVYMMDQLIRWSKHPDSGFYLNDLEGLSSVLRERNRDGHSTLLLGASFALLELAEQYPQELNSHMLVMETGGMKGRRKEMVRRELHGILGQAFGIDSVHSEYGMTEMLSQAYSSGEGIFRCPPWMQVRVRDPNDPLSMQDPGRSGGLNIIDLANLYSCAFLATGDLGKKYDDGSFEVLGRFDHSDIRGCNLLVS
jgi:phenylacetate-coenzyme A ligase PaaK-like adenylate-forming protein